MHTCLFVDHGRCISILIASSRFAFDLFKCFKESKEIIFSFLKDGTDGKQARRTQTSSPLGELFDHGLDSWATLFLPVSLYSMFGRNEFGASVLEMYFILWTIMGIFIISHWEKYNTGILFLPWSYDLAQIVRNVSENIFSLKNF